MVHDGEQNDLLHVQGVWDKGDDTAGFVAVQSIQPGGARVGSEDHRLQAASGEDSHTPFAITMLHEAKVIEALTA